LDKLAKFFGGEIAMDQFLEDNKSIFQVGIVIRTTPNGEQIKASACVGDIMYSITKPTEEEAVAAMKQKLASIFEVSNKNV
jgi:hypothetical protein